MERAYSLALCLFFFFPEPSAVTPFTASAARLLKASLVQPSRDIPTINGRLQCVEEFVGNDDLFNTVEEVVSKFPKARDSTLPCDCRRACCRAVPSDSCF